MKLPPLVPKDEITALGKDFLKIIAYAHHHYGDLVSIPLGKNTILASSPELAEEILIHKKELFVKLGGYGRRSSLQPILGQGLLTNTNHSSWLSQRKLLQPLFSHKSVVKMENKILEAGERLLESWQAKDGQVIDLYQEMLAVTLDIIYDLVFSKPLPREPIVVPLSLATARANRVRQELARLDAKVYGYIEEHRLNALVNGDLLDMLLAARDMDTGEAMSTKQLRDEILTMFSAGHETTAAALTWSWCCLIKYPEKLAILKQELDKVLDDCVPCDKDLEKLPYTLAVIKESLRLYPTIPSCPRVTKEDTKLAGYDIPRGSRVLVSIYNIHHHKKFWSEPNNFQPERFLDKGNFPKKAYMPFGMGQRYCLGKHLAMLESKLLLALIAQNVKFELMEKDPVTRKVAISLFPHNGLKVRLNIR